MSRATYFVACSRLILEHILAALCIRYVKVILLTESQIVENVFVTLVAC